VNQCTINTKTIRARMYVIGECVELRVVSLFYCSSFDGTVSNFVGNCVELRLHCLMSHCFVVLRVDGKLSHVIIL